MVLFANPATSSCLFVGATSPGVTTVTGVAFERPTRSVNSLGEVALSFASVATIAVDLQPGRGSFLRMLQGQVEATTYTGTIQGYVALQDGDRTSVYSALLEITTVGHYGTFQTEIMLKVVR